MRMPISDETRGALELLKEVQNKVRQTEDLRNNRQVGADLNALISVLESPVFQSILNIQDSLRELKRQVISKLMPRFLGFDNGNRLNLSMYRYVCSNDILHCHFTGSTASFNLTR